MNCCPLNTTLQDIYYEHILGHKYLSLGYYTTYYYLLKDLKKQNQLCEKCKDFSEKLFSLYLEMRNKLIQK
jgi:hypothetical protein